ncbi:hypothetical protein BMI90_11755 [Thioclava sp. L04-15]|uniref:hypothetical protein n=1 Tax=Thioclava sp. L04-15 TaxID=1915318 RepID=UPI00099663CD|nr:hypothetical protein [Thioclava sp. L04-15]OOY27862.1 hypothetical protein BMI90_11755 [Thioclava sp. L04-15]TNE90801.1 MAG: hypothetical protein EP337_07335 [Paracoccaceae bacterium]
MAQRPFAPNMRKSHRATGFTKSDEELHAQLVKARLQVAKLMLEKLVYAPIFERPEQEIAAVEARRIEDPLARARAMLRGQPSDASSLSDDQDDMPEPW